MLRFAGEAMHPQDDEPRNIYGSVLNHLLERLAAKQIRHVIEMSCVDVYDRQSVDGCDRLFRVRRRMYERERADGVLRQQVVQKLVGVELVANCGLGLMPQRHPPRRL